MHARQLIELAAWVATHGATLSRSAARLSASGMTVFWSASKCRMERWTRALKEIEAGAMSEPTLQRAWLEEILTGEILTRVTAAVLTAYDRRTQTAEFEPLGRNLWRSQMEVRQQVLALLVSSPQLDSAQAVELNRLRRRCERWNDLLIGKLLLEDDVVEFAIEPNRAAEFTESLREQPDRGTRAWPILLGSLQAAFQTCLLPGSPNADLNERMVAGLLSCFPGELFDGHGLIPSLWLVRMTHTTNDAQGLIEDLIASETRPTSHQTSPARSLLRGHDLPRRSEG